MTETSLPTAEPDALTDATDPAPGLRLCKGTCSSEPLKPSYESRQSFAEYQQAFDRARWLDRFEYHSPHGDQVDRYGRLRAAGRAMAELLIDLTPASDERTRSLEALQQTIMLANAAIACTEKPAA